MTFWNELVKKIVRNPLHFESDGIIFTDENKLIKQRFITDSKQSLMLQQVDRRIFNDKLLLQDILPVVFSLLSRTCVIQDALEAFVIA